MLSTTDIADLLQRVHIFRLLKPEQLVQIAALCEVHNYGSGDVVYSRGDIPQWFYLVSSGEIGIRERTKSRDPESEVLTRLEADDCFGELVANRRAVHRSTATTSCQTTLLAISKSNYRILLRKYPSLADGNRALLRTRKLMTIPRYCKGQPTGGTVASICTPHWIWFARRALFPMIITGIAVLWLVVSHLRDLSSWPGTACSLVSIAWLAVLFLDWRDDKYVVTSKRVISEERLVIFYSSRSEAPLHRVRAVQVSQGTIDRMFGCGDVTIQAFVGRVVFNKVPNPHAVREIILERVRRARASRETLDVQAREQAIREGMGWQSSPDTSLHQVVSVPSAPGLGERISTALRRFLPRFREVHGDVITWRKHPLVLARTVLLLLGGEIILVALLLAMWPERSGVEAAVEKVHYGTGFGFLLLAALLLISWAWYRFEDWRNDIYTITTERLIDSERKPLLGRLTQRTAPIESVLNVSYDSPGILANLFNYGTITIQTGGESGELTFDWVVDPKSVQQEILLRMEQCYQQREDVEATQRSIEIVEWLRAYADVTDSNRPVP